MLGGLHTAGAAAEEAEAVQRAGVAQVAGDVQVGAQVAAVLVKAALHAAERARPQDHVPEEVEVP